MKIVILGTVASSVVTFRAELIKTLVANGNTVYAFAIDYDDVTFAEAKSLGAFPVKYNFNRAGLNPFKDIANTLALARKLKNIAPDLIFSYFSKPVIFGTLAAALARINKRIGMLEGLGYLFTEQPHRLPIKTKVLKLIQISLYKAAFPLLDRLIFLNPDDRIDLVDRYRLKVNKIDILGGIGLNLEDYPYSVPNIAQISFIFVGRLLVEKGIREFISAAKSVKDRYPEARFIVLGSVDKNNPGSLSEDAIKELTDKGLITYPGHVSKVAEWIANASVFVLPSYREGVPRSTQEAMAIGRAVITTDVPGCRETVINGVNGFLIPPWQPSKLAEKMVFFIEHPNEIQRMGLESHRIAKEKFDAQKVNKLLISYLLDHPSCYSGKMNQ